MLLRGGVLRALSQRGCRSGWTVSNFRGRARLHITARAGDGHRKQLLLPYPWESDQLEAIRDGVVAVYDAFHQGVPLEQAIAELSEAKAEADARRQAAAMASEPSVLQPSVMATATTNRSAPIDWPGLIRRYQQHKLRSGEIKETTWERLYRPRMALVLKTVKGPPVIRDATQLLEAQADQWSQRPGCRTRRMQIQYTAALGSEPKAAYRPMGSATGALTIHRPVTGEPHSHHTDCRSGHPGGSGDHPRSALEVCLPTALCVWPATGRAAAPAASPGTALVHV